MELEADLGINMEKNVCMTPENREDFKRQANYRTLSGAFDVLYADFDGSWEAWYSAKGRKKDHPSYEEYAAAYVANSHCDELFGEKVARELRKRYPCRPSRHLPDGCTNWSSKPAKLPPRLKLPREKFIWPPPMTNA